LAEDTELLTSELVTNAVTATAGLQQAAPARITTPAPGIEIASEPCEDE
jgi:hypothetical protein